MSRRIILWKLLVVVALVVSVVGVSHLVYAGSQSKGNKGYLYIRHGQETIKAQKRLKEKAVQKKARRMKKEKAPKTKWVEVYFNSGSAKIVSPSNYRLNTAARLLKINKQKKVVIIGSADYRGAAEDNQALALKRANAVKNYLVKEGISAQRLQVKSVGDTKARGTGSEAMAKDRSAKFQLILRGLKK